MESGVTACAVYPSFRAMSVFLNAKYLLQIVIHTRNDGFVECGVDGPEGESYLSPSTITLSYD